MVVLIILIDLFSELTHTLLNLSLVICANGLCQMSLAFIFGALLNGAYISIIVLFQMNIDHILQYAEIIIPWKIPTKQFYWKVRDVIFTR